VRELSHVIERAVIFGAGAPLDFNSLGEPPAAGSRPRRNPAWRPPVAGFSLDGMIDELIADVLREEEGNVSAAARRLGITRDVLRHRLGERKSEKDGTG
jgi:two-component system response regulator AtoC